MPPNAHEEIVGLDVAVDEVLVVHELDAGNHLVGQHQHRLHCEPVFRGGKNLNRGKQSSLNSLWCESIVVNFFNFFRHFLTIINQFEKNFSLIPKIQL